MQSILLAEVVKLVVKVVSSPPVQAGWSQSQQFLQLLLSCDWIQVSWLVHEQGRDKQELGYGTTS